MFNKINKHELTFWFIYSTFSWSSSTIASLG